MRWRQMCDSDKILAEVSDQCCFGSYIPDAFESKFVSGRVYEMRAQMNAGKAGETEKLPMLERLLQYQYSSSQSMPDHDIISECIGHL